MHANPSFATLENKFQVIFSRNQCLIILVIRQRTLSKLSKYLPRGLVYIIPVFFL